MTEASLQKCEACYCELVSDTCSRCGRPAIWEMNQLVDAWILFVERKGDEESDRYDWANDLVQDWSSGGKNANLLWEFILEAYQRKTSERAIGALAAGPLEDLLGYRGEKYIDKIEELAKKDERFNYLLGGVWQNSMSNDVWETIKRIRRTEW